jgi:Holliday junction resolvasome RuvABC endonuclease subunit
MKFISIDSSLANTGVAIGRIEQGEILVDEIHLLQTEKAKEKQVRASSDTISRCRKTFQFIHEIMSEHNPVVVFVETPSGSQNASGMKSYGSTCQLIASILPPPIEVTATEVKMASVGEKSASKESIINWAYKKYPNLKWFFNGEKLQNKNEHVADAIAIAYAAVKTNEFKRLITFY